MSLRPVLAVAFAALLIGCGRQSAEPSVRLADIFDPSSVAGTPSSGAMKPAAMWDFSKSNGDALGWTAGPGVADLKVVDGKLTGRATDDLAVIYAPTPEGLDPSDNVFGVEVRLASSAGGAVSAATRGDAKVEFDKALLDNLRTRTPAFKGELAAAGQPETLMMTTAAVSEMSGAKALLVQPVKQKGATFEIESIRLVSQRESRADNPTGVGWQGLSDVFYETISSRSPEKFTVKLDIPSNSWLDLQVGTVEPAPLTFQILDVTSSEPKTLLRRTVTTPHRWEDASLDLAGEAGSRTLEFSLDGAEDFRVGFWGSPVIRVHGASAKTDIPVAEALGGAAQPQGVIWFMCDTLRKDHLSLYGYERETSPNLTKMAAGGAMFLDNISQATWTKASVPSMMTSLYPTSDRVEAVPDRLSSVATTAAEVFRAAGYATVSFSSVAFTGKLSNLHQGYEELHESGSVMAGDHRGKTARPYVDQATDWIKRHKDTPFFMFLHVFDPHAAYEPRAPYDSMWTDLSKKEQHEKDREAGLKAANGDRRGGRLPFQSDLEKAGVDKKEWLKYEESWYDGSIRGMDAELGRLLENLRSLGLDKNVMVVFVADHGDEFDEHGRMWHGQSTYGELNRVPLVFYRPGVIPAGVRVKETVRNLDVMPTLLDLSGLAAPAGIQGQSLAPLIGGKPGWTPLPAVTEKAANPEGESPTDFESYGLILDGWKIIHNTKGRGDKPEFELYNHAEDPLNQNNLASQEPDRLKKLEKELDAWHSMAIQNQLPKGDAPENITPEEEDRLRSLGYIQ